jgi:tripartite-type tricarboxylate transporter receptor subunit TctC
VPAVAETLPGFVLKNWFGLSAPAGINMERVNLLNNTVKRVLQDPEVAKTFIDAGVEAVGDTPAQFSNVIKTETERWQKLLSSRDIKID